MAEPITTTTEATLRDKVRVYLTAPWNVHVHNQWFLRIVHSVRSRLFGAAATDKHFDRKYGITAWFEAMYSETPPGVVLGRRR